MNQPLLKCEHVDFGYENYDVVKDVSMEINPGDYLCIVGENGSGKSTLMKGLLGLIKPTGGVLTLADELRRSGIGYLPQQTPAQKDFPATVQEVVISGCLGKRGNRPFYSMEERKLAAVNMEKLGITDLKKSCYRDLSGGQKQRTLIARALCATDKLLILDEPTNHMDLAGKEALEKMLTSYEGTVLFVSHDRYFINQVATGILEFGESDVQFYGMNYAQYLEEIKRQTPGRETGNAGGIVRKSADVPTLDDVFDKKKYYNPGKILSRLKRQLEKYEEQLAESESRMSELQLEMMDPELSANYERLMELQTKIDEENQTQESLLERMMETELELEEMETQDE